MYTSDLGGTNVDDIITLEVHGTNVGDVHIRTVRGQKWRMHTLEMCVTKAEDIYIITTRDICGRCTH